MIPYAATTDGVTVTVRPAFLDGRSDVLAGRFVFGYFVRVENAADEDVQLLRRHWIIRDARGHVQEVEGAGVIGKQPVIGPGEAHAYNSFCVLETFEGHMEGTYLMEWADGARFKATIPRFYLRAHAN